MAKPQRRPKPSQRKKVLPLVGWREWVALPELGIAYTKAKIDTGARTSSLHAFEPERFRRGGRDWVRFEIHPLQRSLTSSVTCTAEVVEERSIRSSNGQIDVRPVIHTAITVGGRTFPIELTLAARDTMGFRMLLGRRALRRRFAIDPGRSFLGGVPEAVRIKRAKRAKRKKKAR